MRTKKITEVFSCDNMEQVKTKIETALNSRECELVEFNVKMKDVKENGEIVGTEYLLKLVKQYD